MYYLILGVATIIIVAIAIYSNLLRNKVFNPANFQNLAKSMGITNPKPSFSLGKSQLAFWTVIIVSSFIFVYISANPQKFISPVLDAVNLTLLGIAAGTTILAKAIDNSQQNNQGATIPQQDYPSQGFLIDILSDENGVNIHRLQNVIWTAIVGAIYIAFVATSLLLPTDKVITTQLLILMGISNGAYLGLKASENKS